MHEKPARAKRGISPLLVFALVLLALVLAVAGILGWQFWGTNVLAARAAADDVARLREQFLSATPVVDADGAPTVDQPVMHEPAWILRIPALDVEWPIVAGVDGADLARGIGWYPGSALPGQVGNFALAGHRVAHGSPFGRLLALKIGDEVIVETPAASFTYTLTVAPGDLTVAEDASWVLDPVPGKTDQVPTSAVITLTTAEDLIPTPDRAVGFGTLTTTETP